MARTVIGIFDTREQAEAVIGDLIKAGLERTEISILARDTTSAPATGGTTTAVDEDTVTGGDTAKGALVGGVGGLLLGLGALAIPGIGPVIAAGPIAAALTGAGIGAAGGAVVGALTDSGVPERDAQFYAERLNSGGTLVTVTCDDTLADPASHVMEQHGAKDVEEKMVHSGSTPIRDEVATAGGLTSENAEVSTGSIGASVVDPASQRRVGSYPAERKESVRETLEDAAGIPDEDWRNHFRQHYEGQGEDYDYFAPGYRYGSEAALSDRYRGRRYDEIESDLRRDYENRYPGSAWDRIREAVRHGWERATNRNR